MFPKNHQSCLLASVGAASFAFFLKKSKDIADNGTLLAKMPIFSAPKNSFYSKINRELIQKLALCLR